MTIETTLAPTAAQLSAIAQAAQKLSGSTASLAELIAAAGHARKDVRDAFRSGYMVGYMRAKGGQPQYSMKDAVKALAGTGHGRTVAGKVARSEAEEKAYGAAKTALSAILRTLGVQTDEKRGGNRGKGNGKAKPEKEAVIPTAPTAKDAAAHIELQIASLLAYVEKNAPVIDAAYATALTICAKSLQKAKMR
jgi:hypothetical protein